VTEVKSCCQEWRNTYEEAQHILIISRPNWYQWNNESWTIQN